MKWAVLAIVSACNWSYGIVSTQDRDGSVAFFDRPTDAPPQCPAYGTAPQFSSQIHQIFAKPCQDYMTSATSNRALTMCEDPGNTVEEGSVDGEVAIASGFPDTTTSVATDVDTPPGRTS